jgi:hypothetical protein
MFSFIRGRNTPTIFLDIINKKINLEAFIDEQIMSLLPITKNALDQGELSISDIKSTSETNERKVVSQVLEYMLENNDDKQSNIYSAYCFIVKYNHNFLIESLLFHCDNTVANPDVKLKAREELRDSIIDLTKKYIKQLADPEDSKPTMRSKL